MDITKIDKNFIKTQVTKESGSIFTLPCKPFGIYGGWFEEGKGFLKMPIQIAEQISPGVAWGSRCTAGVRILFATDAKFIKLNAKLYAKCLMNHMAMVGSASFTLCEDVNGEEIFVGNFIPSLNVNELDVLAQVNLKGDEIRNYILYLPLYSGVESLSLEFNEGAIIGEFNKYIGEKPILYYGSSITQGGCASKPNNCYQAYISEWLKVDHVNLGFSGSAKAEDMMIEYLAGVDCSVFVCDYDHNASSVEHLQNTHEKLFKAFRSNPKHANTPVVLISKPDVYKEFGDVRFEIIKKTYENALNKGDKNVYLIDGREFYPKDIFHHCSVDDCHPTDLGFYFMAKKIYEVLKNLF